MVWLLHHAVEGHNEGHHKACQREHHEEHHHESGVECPICLIVSSLFLIAIIVAPCLCAVLIARVRQTELSYLSLETLASYIRGPPRCAFL